MICTKCGTKMKVGDRFQVIHEGTICSKEIKQGPMISKVQNMKTDYTQILCKACRGN